MFCNHSIDSDADVVRH